MSDPAAENEAGTLSRNTGPEHDRPGKAISEQQSRGISDRAWVHLATVVPMLANLAAMIEEEGTRSDAAHAQSAAHRLSPAGMRHGERFQMLSKTQQRFIKRIIDVLLEMNASASSVNSK